MPMPTTAMAVMEAVTAVAFTDTARGPLMPRPTTVPDTAMAAMAVTAVAFTDTARGPLMPMPTTAMAVMEAMAAMVPMVETARGPLMPMPTTAMAVMAVTAVDTDTDTARGPLTLTTAVDTAMAAMAMVATPTASNFVQVCNNILIPNCHSNHLKTSSYNGGQEN